MNSENSGWSRFIRKRCRAGITEYLPSEVDEHIAREKVRVAAAAAEVAKRQANLQAARIVSMGIR